MSITKEWCEQKIEEYLLKEKGKLEYVVEYYQIDFDGSYEMIFSNREWRDEASIAPYREIWNRLLEDFYADSSGDDSEEALDEYMHEYFLDEVESQEIDMFGDGIPQTMKIFINPELYARIMYYTRDVLFKHKEHVAEMTAINNIAEEILADKTKELNYL